ncbi:chain-length determining protein [Falsochrobactrum shanghaiense]|uniref:Chain-length determining protein n=1 Tax=Falsochrobactrum shanghaiense TaxID=2201899 RepID=A0A316J7M9_9HYPH|nr:GumC family protein [Falsochrobactrum shanghaiense]PWL17346.1 chain-length determining protein [Falsochrobactrum shanghaiense]
MSGENKRSKGREDKPLLAFSDARDRDRTQSGTPPWTPPATPEERAAFFRDHKATMPPHDDHDIQELNRRIASVRRELERKLEEQEHAHWRQNRDERRFEEEDVAPQPEVARNRHVSPASVTHPDTQNEWKPLIDPRVVVDVLKGSRRLLIATTLLGGIAAAAYAMTLPKTYEATTDLLVDPRNIKTVGTELTPGPLPTDASLAIAESQARMIDSSSVLLKVIEQSELTKDPEFNGSLAPVGIAGLIAQIRSLFKPQTAADEQALETRVLYNLHKNLFIGRDAKTFIYSIGVKTLDPQKSADLANTISTVFQSELASLNSDAARRNSEELAQRLSEMRSGVEQAEKAVADFRATHDLVDVDGKLISDNELTRLNDQLTNQRNETMRLQARVQVLNSATRDSVVSGTMPEDMRSNTLTALRSQFAAANQAANGMATRLGPRHPQLMQLQSQKQTLLNDIDAELRRIRASLQVEVQRSDQQEKDLSARLAQLKSQQANSNDDRVRLRELQREAETQRSVYEAFLLRARETEEQEGITTTNIRVLSEARPPLDPSGPPRKLIVLMGLVLGLLTGLGIAVVRNFGRLVRF